MTFIFKFRTLVAIVMLIGLSLASPAHSSVKLIFPPFKTAIRTPYLAVAGEAAPGKTIVWQHIKKDGVVNFEILTEVTGIFSTVVELEPGTNQMVFEGTFVEVYYAEGAEPIPQGFFEYRAHASDISACEDCHDTDMSLYDGGFPGVCLACHVVVSQNPDNLEDPLDNSHFTAVSKQCNNCHDYHFSQQEKLLLKEAREPCRSCHPNKYKGAQAHEAYEEGSCSACHESHFSGFPYNLHMASPDICHECHDEASKSTAENFHPPSAVENGKWCMECHDPHATSSSLLVSSKSVTSLCTSCHTQILEHGHGDELEECINCHDPHKTLGTSLLSSQFSKEGCAECHDDMLEGETVHPAAEEGCEQCHNPHIDDNVARASVLCLDCHEFSAGSETASLHGNLPMEIGDCLMCHPPHASSQDSLVRAKTHFPLTQSKCDACHGAEPPGRLIDDVQPRCSKCHSLIRNLEASGATIHDPVEENCVNCHDPHMSDTKPYLLDEMPKVCIECHDDLISTDAGSAMHEAAESCNDCHDVHGGETEKFLVGTPPELCLECHDDPVENPDGMHPALEEGCTSCHNPHSGFDGAILSSAMPGICYDCHDDPTVGAKSIHPALDEGCTACHDPHSSENETLLKLTDNELCLECHDDPSEGGEAHPAIDEGCITCHNPHASKNDSLLNLPDSELCLECHDDPREGKRVAHDALEEGCISCHNGHVSKNGPLLDADVNEKCFECHDNPEDEGEVHPALEEGCTACHNPHASDNEKMFTTPGDGLCLECHDDPREGKAVIHDALDEGCTACHNGHYSKGGPLLAASVNETCAQCHDELDEEHHYLDADAADEYPDGNFPTVGDKLSCVGCHNPHAADEGALFAKPEDTLCSSCH